MTEAPLQPETHTARHWPLSRLLRFALLVIAGIFFVLHFLHLKADFPNHSPWNDWAKYTDEGWYGDAAIRHYVSGHWYWQGDFNPAVALPALPALEWIVFAFTGVSPQAARAMTLCIFGIMLLALWLLLEKHTRPRSRGGALPLAGSIALLMLCTSPFLYVFERMAIIEPLLLCLTVLALLTASHLHPLRLREPSLLRRVAPAIALGLLMPAMILAKTTAIALFPAVGYILWSRAGYRIRPALRMAVVPFGLTAAVWLSYIVFFVRPHYLKDYQYLFAANAYTGIELDPIATVVMNTLHDALWMGSVLFISFIVLLALAVFWRPRVFTNPLIPALLLWVGGYFAFLMYHNNLQPRYYTVVAVPITALVALGLDAFREARGRKASIAATAVAAAVVIAITVPDAIQQIGFIRNPTYDFEAAAQGIARIVNADTTHPRLILSISGSDITLMTGVPSICDDFGTDDLDVRVKKYHPGWYVAWNDIEDDKMDALRPLYQPIRVAEFPAYDDADRNLLILYRLDPHPATPEPVRKHRKPPPKQLITNIGEQPSTTQLKH